MAVDHNEFVAQTTNRQTVLNILRAREREPIHYTSFSTVAGKLQATGQAGLNATLNGDSSSATDTTTGVENLDAGRSVIGGSATNTLTQVATQGATNFAPSVSIGVTTGTDFQLASNATQEFYRGILGPLSSNTVVHFLRQGYPADLLSHLVIGRFQFFARVVDPNGGETLVPLTDMVNAPDEESSSAFAHALRCRQLSYAIRSIPAAALPITDVSSLSDVGLDVLNRLKASDVGREDGRIEEANRPRYQFVTPARTEFPLALSSPNEPECTETRAAIRNAMVNWVAGQGLVGRPPSSYSAPDRSTPIIQSNRPTERTTSEPEVSEGLTGAGGATFSSKGYFDDLLPPGYSSELVIETTLRSVEGIIYYLGEYIRNEQTSPRLWGNNCPGPGYCIPVIRVRPITEIPSSERFVEVGYRGRTYAVPLAGTVITPEGGRSSQVIALVQQLLNLHRSSADFPATPFVRVIN